MNKTISCWIALYPKTMLALRKIRNNLRKTKVSCNFKWPGNYQSTERRVNQTNHPRGLFCTGDQAFIPTVVTNQGRTEPCDCRASSTSDGRHGLQEEKGRAAVKITQPESFLAGALRNRLQLSRIIASNKGQTCNSQGCPYEFMLLAHLSELMPPSISIFRPS